MRTEDLARPQQRPDNDGPSPALLEHTPAQWWIADERGRPVTLSRAGHVLHFSRTYKLWVGPFADAGPPPDLRFISRPTWIVSVPGPRTADKHGLEGACMTFQVRRQLGWWLCYRWLWEVHSEVIEVEAVTTTAAGQERRTVLCPLVARSRWLLSLVVLAIAGAALFTVGEIVIKQGAQELTALVTTGGTSVSWQFSWFWPVVGAIVSPVAAFANTLWHLRCRSRELLADFRRRWPTAAAWTRGGK